MQRWVYEHRQSLYPNICKSLMHRSKAYFSHGCQLPLYEPTEHQASGMVSK